MLQRTIPLLEFRAPLCQQVFSKFLSACYKIGFAAFDTSTNGAIVGPIHTATEELPVWFQAGVNIQSVTPDYSEGQVACLSRF